jgi:hypothetical protein
MKVKEILEKVQRPAPDDFSDITPILEELEIHGEWLQTPRIVYRFISSWLCTDTIVGMRVWWLDDDIIAISSQTARKNSHEFYWISKEKRQTTLTFLQTLLAETKEPGFSLLDPEEELGDGFDVYFTSQLLRDRAKAYLKGEEVEVLFDQKPVLTQTIVEVKHKATGRLKVKAEELTFPWSLGDEK